MSIYSRIDSEIDKLFLLNVDDIGIYGSVLSIRLQNILIKMGIESIAKLNQSDAETIKTFRGMGKKTCAEIDDYFNRGDPYKGIQSEISKHNAHLSYVIKYLHGLSDRVNSLIDGFEGME